MNAQIENNVMKYFKIREIYKKSMFIDKTVKING